MAKFIKKAIILLNLLAIKLKRWHKIILISIAVITVILISFNMWFEYYLRKSLEKEFNKSLNAVVTIGNVDMKFLSGQIVIEDFVLVGKNEFSNDTIISCGSIIAEPGEFDSKTSTLNFKRLIADNLAVKTVIAESGNTNWDNLIIEQDSSSTDQEEQMKLFLEKLIITDGFLEYEDRSNHTSYSLRDIDLVVSFDDDSTFSTADYKFSAAFFQDSVNFVDLRLYGSLKSSESETNLVADLFVGKVPVKLNASIPADSVAESITKVEALVDFSGLNFENAFSSGSLLLNLDFTQSFSSLNLKIDADSIKFSKPDSSSLFFADFKLKSNLKMIDRPKLMVEFSDCFIISHSVDTLSGDFLLNLSDSTLKIDSDLNGKINLEIPFSNFGDYKGTLIFKTQIESDLTYYCNSKSEKSEGKINAVSKLSNPYFKILNYELLFSESKFTSAIKLDSDFIFAEFNCVISDFLSYFNYGTVKTVANIDVGRIKIPKREETKGDFFKNVKYSEDPTEIAFPKFIQLDLQINIDTISIGNFYIYNFVNQIYLSPEFLTIKSNRTEIGSGSLQYEVSVRKEDNDTIYYSMFNLSNFDLAYFSKKDSKIAGVIEINSENTLYNKSSAMKNSGQNLVSLKGFKMPVNFLKEYGIDEDALVISDFDLVINLYSDSIKIQPNTINVNKVQAAISGTYNYYKDDISVRILLDAPESYLSPEIKIALAMFSEKSPVKLPKKKGRIIRHLNIAGSLKSPKFKIFE
ncbi:MAG: hypothetical protein PHE56_13595 [Bacteroidales bacterium]|nr:hypothetical protein [Bacteroidales bacterium]